MFFGEEEPTPTPSEELIDAQPSAQEYKDAIMLPLRQQLGAALDDPKTLEAVQAQVSIAVDTTLVKSPNLSAEAKLEEMTRQVILIRNLRDIAQGIKAASDELAKGTAPEAVRLHRRSAQTEPSLLGHLQSQLLRRAHGDDSPIRGHRRSALRLQLPPEARECTGLPRNHRSHRIRLRWLVGLRCGDCKARGGRGLPGTTSPSSRPLLPLPLH